MTSYIKDLFVSIWNYKSRRKTTHQQKLDNLQYADGYHYAHKLWVSAPHSATLKALSQMVDRDPTKPFNKGIDDFIKDPQI